MSSVGLYLHIPFCRSKCAYCDFNSYAQMEHLHDRYVQALCTEIRRFTQQHAAFSVDTIYIGGGTPTTLPPSLLSQALAVCRQAFAVAEDVEITIEANPGTVNQDDFVALRAAGVNRISLGAQSFNEQELRLLERIHTVDQTREAFRLARAAGINNISLDLIYGLPRQTIADWRSTLDHALQLAPEHISAYALSVEDGTPLAKRIANATLPPPDADVAAEMYVIAEERLQQEGYQHYELSNWAATRMLEPNEHQTLLCRHNLKYWRVEPYLGFGAGAHSCFDGHRYCNVSHPEDYLSRLEEGLSPVSSTKAIGLDESMAETMILGLRLIEGIRFSDFAQRHGRDPQVEYADELVELQQLGLLVRDEQSVYLTQRGRLLANQVFIRFWPRTVDG